jgi:TonB-dependent starch-binding outer membrane protein SusC
MQITTYVRRIALLMVGMVLSLGMVIAQERTITGKVTAEGEGAVPGVNVTVQGTTVGAITDVNGGYSIKVPGPSSVLLFSSIGYATQAITVGTKTVVDVVLVSETKALQEVVVTGYTTQRRRDLTGAVATVEPQKLTAIPTGNVSNNLQGVTSGVTVTGSGAPGQTSKVRIRGFASFENNDPLYVVDGVPTQDISSLNPNDVQNISVLKDAGAASIYGSRASNGVIIIQTKRGSTGTKVSYNMYVGFSDPGKGPTDLCTQDEYAKLQWLVYKNTGIVETHPIYGPSSNPEPTLPNWAGNTNWYKAITHMALKQNHDLTFSTGSENAKFFAGIGVNQEKGIVIYTEANRYNGRFNSEFTFLKGRVKVGENITMAYRTSLGNATGNNLNEGSQIQVAMYRMPAIVPVKITVPIPNGLTHDFEPGDWGGTGIAARLGQAGNVVANQTLGKDNKGWNFHMIGSAYLDVQILKGLNFKSTLGGNFDNGYYWYYNFKTYWNAENATSNSFYENAYFGDDWVWTNQLTFDKTFGQHKILVVAGYEAVKYGMYRENSAAKSGYFSDDPLYRTVDNGSQLLVAHSTSNTPTAMISQFARVDYSFMDRYMLSATVRRDGSSRFGSSFRYGVFPSVSLGWRIKDESFLANVGWLSDLKLRASYGTMGNQLAVSPENQFFSYGGSISSSAYDLNGSYTSPLAGFRPTRIGNADAKWETNITTDAGFEASLFKNTIGIKFDWYLKKTKDLLFNPELPGAAGGATVPYINIAAMTNKGVDLELSYNNKFGEIGFSGSFLLTTYKNNIDKIAATYGVTFFDAGNQTNTANRINGNPNRDAVGHPMSAFYGYKVLGLFQSAEEVASAPTQSLASPGTYRFQDTNGDKKITADDRTWIGNPNPKFTYGLNLTLTYKNFDLTAFLYGSQGNDIWDWNRWWVDYWPAFQGQKSKDLLYNSWTPTNKNARLPITQIDANFSTSSEVTSALIEKGSFAKLKNLQIGFTIPQSILSKINIGSLRVYVQAVNLFTITKYTGLDPELGGYDTAFGLDAGNYPLVKEWLVGLNVNF